MPKSILIVDDNLLVRTILRDYLQQVGFFVCGEAVDGFDALTKVKRLEPDLVILDLVMPGMNGFETARALRELPRKLSIVLFTMHAGVISDQDAKEAGIDLIFAKANLDHLHQGISGLLEAN